MIKHTRLFSLVGMVVALSGCSYFEHAVSPAPYSRQQICAHLKDQLVFGTNTPHPDANYDSPIEKAKVAKEYERYRCADFEQQTHLHSEQ